MPIVIKGAKEHNLQVDQLVIHDGLTVITGVSGSGKSSLVFNTIYHEAYRQFHEIFGSVSSSKTNPASVDEITGLRPAIAIDQNVLNRNPNSTVSSASGLNPLFRILFARYGIRKCSSCGSYVQLYSKEEIIQIVLDNVTDGNLKLQIPLVLNQAGPFTTLVKFVVNAFPESIECEIENDPVSENNSILLGLFITKDESISDIRNILDIIDDLSIERVIINSEFYSWSNSCQVCGSWLIPIEPKIFHTACPYCKGTKCQFCNFTGIHPLSLDISWKNNSFSSLLQFSIQDAYQIFLSASLNEISPRLQKEINSRLHALIRVGLDYVSLDRPVPSLSRGETQRVRLALALINNLEDMLYILDEPTIGLHIKNVLDIIPEFRNLKGSVIFVEHDKVAAANSDYAIEIGPGAGSKGGKIVFNGTTEDLWNKRTLTGEYFNHQLKVDVWKRDREAYSFLVVKNCILHNLKHITVKIPLNRFTVITGVSGSGKTSFAVDTLVRSLLEKSPIGCSSINDFSKKIVLVDQNPIGKNPRSNPATYTKLTDIIRDVFSKRTELPAPFFSFNREEGACPECKGIGSIEVKMTYLPSSWIQCEACNGKRFNEQVLNATINIKGKFYSIDDVLSLTIDEAYELLLGSDFFEDNQINVANSIFKSLIDIGLGYLQLGQPSPTLSGGEAQRIKLTRFLARSNVSDTIFVLDEPSTGLHPADITGLLVIFERLLDGGATVIVIEHNSDIINAADWIVDLGPGSGNNGGSLLYCGDYNGFLQSQDSITSQMLAIEQNIKPSTTKKATEISNQSNYVTISNAKVNNLQNISVKFPKNSLIIITGISGSGKSSLVSDIIEIEARRRFLESLSMYERQSTHEGAEIEAKIEGLGVSFSINAKKERYYLRNNVGFYTNLSQQFSVLFSQIGEQYCPDCQIKMKKQNNRWSCLKCKKSYEKATPTHFSSRNYSSACLKCHGVGTISIPKPEKLIIHPDKPLCGGAMYSPGFFPKGYLCKEGNGGYYYLRALAQLYNFDPEETPWNEMSEEAQKAFLFGSDEILAYESFGLKGHHHVVRQINKGFYYGFLREWDVGGTYTDHIPCPECHGGGLRTQYQYVKIKGLNFNDVQYLALENLLRYVKSFENLLVDDPIGKVSYKQIIEKLTFLTEVGLGYLHLKRTVGTLSAGEAQRIKLASFLGSNIQGLTITLDEPTRGLHPKEVEALISVLKEIVGKNNTVLVIEHDLDVIKSGDYLVELGPKSGKNGGKIINKGSYEEFITEVTATTHWLKNKRYISRKPSIKTPKTFLKLLGAKENNLKGDTLEIPLGFMVGVCGVSGSGKSTLIIDTLGRIISPQKQTTSVAYEPIEPGKYESIVNKPRQAIIIDQVKKGINNPLNYFDLEKRLIELYIESDDFVSSGLKKDVFKKKCSNCKGEGLIKTDMGFLPPIFSQCDICSGTGLVSETSEVRLHGYTLSELYSKSIDELAELFVYDQKLKKKLDIIQKLGMGYLLVKQPAYSLSGGEIQRLKIAKELIKKKHSRSLFLIDEPSLGLHMDDIDQLLHVLRTIVDEKNTVVIVEHNPYILASCDWLIELGPEGGEKGGYIINSGPPIEFVKQNTPTSSYIKEMLP